MRRMSFSKTTRQMRWGLKIRTMRIAGTWQHTGKGDVVMAIEKGQGIPKGGHQVEIGPIEILSVTGMQVRNVTRAILLEEGFPYMSVPTFVHFFCKLNKCDPSADVNSFLFKRLYEVEPYNPAWFWTSFAHNTTPAEVEYIKKNILGA